MKKIISFILSIILCSSIFASSFQEIMPLEKNTSYNLEENLTNFELENKSLVTQDKGKESFVKTRIEDLGIKRIASDGKVYAGNETVPYSGKFALFLGDITEYTETYVDGILNGPKTWYSHNGIIILEENYINNKVEGEQKAYHENGNIKSIVNYKNGKIIGIEAFAKNGSLLHKSDLSKGTGIWKYFWENGNILEEGNYKNWKKDGKWIKYRENGKVDVTTIYKNGKLIEQIWS